MEINPDDMKKIEALSAQGDELLEDDDFEGAIQSYEDALKLVPLPFHDWEAATFLLTAIGDTAYMIEEYEKAQDNLQKALLCPDGLGNPFIHLRLGETFFEMENLDKAADELMRAYMGAGDEIFEDEDPKYLAFLKTRAQIN